MITRGLAYTLLLPLSMDMISPGIIAGDTNVTLGGSIPDIANDDRCTLSAELSGDARPLGFGSGGCDINGPARIVDTAIGMSTTGETGYSKGIACTDTDEPAQHRADGPGDDGGSHPFGPAQHGDRDDRDRYHRRACLRRRGR